jgi:UPF0271 protein
LKHEVAIGAHPSFPDRENFGRTEMKLSIEEIRDTIIEQVSCLARIASGLGCNLHHVKPHGALYNMAAKNISLARAIAETIKSFDNSLILYGLSGSHSIHEEKRQRPRPCTW